MASPKRIQPGELIKLELDVADRATIRNSRHVDVTLARRIAEAPASRRKIAFTLPELEQLSLDLRAGIEDVASEQRREELRRVLTKVDRERSRYVVGPPPPSPAQRATGIPATVNLGGWANYMLACARQANVATERLACKVMLSKAQRRTLLGLELDEAVRTQLSVDAKGVRTFHFTPDELVAVCRALAEPLATTTGAYRNQLLKAAEKVAQALSDTLSNATERPRRIERKTAYQLLITLREIKPTVWRRFQVADCCLAELHTIVQIVMGWENRHHHYFGVGRKTYSDLALRAGKDHGDARQVKLSSLMSGQRRRFDYVYDMGDCWQHMIEIESAFQPEDRAEFPLCLEGRGSCPPEDIGGPEGYAEFLEVINDFSDPEQKDYLDWCGGWFDPDAFDLELVNRALSKTFA